jgi:ABC-type transport system involved in multi-copper enzyme maturation permease subunit
MFPLIKIEWLKLKKYSAFWWMSGIVALTYPGINLLFYKIYATFTSGKSMGSTVVKTLLGSPFAFPETWHSVAYFSSFFIFIPSILVIMIITNEYNYKTHRQNIIDGWSRDQFITSKISDVAIITSFATAVYFITALCFGLFSADSSGSFADQLQYLPLFFLQTFAQLSIAFLLGFLMKKAFMALAILIFYSLIVEKILVVSMNHFIDGAGRFLPFEVSNHLIPPPQFFRKANSDAYDESIHLIGQHCVYTILLTAGIWWLCYSIYRKRDL